MRSSRGRTRAGWAAVARAAALVAVAGCAGRPAGPPPGVTLVRQETELDPALVREAQQLLRRRGLYAGPVDGELAPALRVALATVQRDRGLPVTGTLDAPTVQALGLSGAAPARQEAGAPAAEEPLPPLEEAFGTVEPRPQPPAGALATAHEEAGRILAGAARDARELLADPAGGRPGAGRLGQADLELSNARVAAFDRLLAARERGRFEPLPPPLQAELEAALGRRALLLHGADGAYGPDDEQAVRWVERSLGLRETGRPSLRLLEALGIDPTPMFEP